MISPSMWMILAYMLTAPFAAALTACLLHNSSGKRSIMGIFTAVSLGFCLIVSFIRGVDAFLGMFPLFMPLFGVSLWCSGYFAVECVKKRNVLELGAGDVMWAMGTYFGFLLAVLFLVPALRWCEGCMEWH